MFDADLTWRITPLTALLFTAATDVAETTTTDTGGVLERQYALALRHSFSTRLIGTTGISYYNRDFVGGDLTEPNKGDFFVRLKSGKRRPVDQVMEDIRGRIEREVPGLSIEMAQLLEDLIGDLTAVPQPVEVRLFSNSPKELPPLAQKIADAIGKVQGVVDVKDGINPAGDALVIHVHRAQAAIEGLDPARVIWRLPPEGLPGNLPPREPRSGSQLLDALLARLPAT